MELKDVMQIGFERPRGRGEIMKTSEFYEYRRRLPKFLDDCEDEKKERALAKTR